MGVMYKFGYTTLSSARERLALRQNGDERYLDRVLFFGHFDNAADIEQAVHERFAGHALFSRFGPQVDMPLYNNGQSELYSTDILRLDPLYNISQSRQTEKNITTKMYGQTAELTAQQAIAQQESDALIERMTPFIRALFRMLDFISNIFASNIERRRTSLIKSLNKRIAAEAERDIELGFVDTERARRLKEKIIADRLKEKEDRIPSIERDIVCAMAALKERDIKRFESIVDIEAFGANVADAMTQDFVVFSDYLGVASNAWMIKLVDAMADAGSTELLLRPVRETYCAALRELVSLHQLRDEDLHLPNEDVYKEEEPSSAEHEQGLSSHLAGYFAPKIFLDLFGRKWTLPDVPTFKRGASWVEFPIQIENDSPVFSGELILRVSRAASRRLELSFPTFIQLLANAQETTGHVVRGINHMGLELRQSSMEQEATV
ncbi:hypothetical protein B1810_22030 [Panacagrimonas perspica]|nr:hypothetical protein B1810_22030 [Panacagrimonas perspica]